MVFRSLLVILGLLLVVTLSQAISAQVVRGQVVDSVTGVPIGQASVALLGAEGIEQAGTVADPQGLFLLRPETPGNYRLQVQHEGYRLSTFPPFDFGLFECPPLLFRDRIYLGDPWYVSIDEVVPLADVVAVEVYTSSANVPLELSRPGSECGTVVFWTQ